MLAHLKWDSNFFGLNIGFVNTLPKTKQGFMDLVARAISESFDCFYMLCNESEDMTPFELESLGFSFVDIRLTLSLEIIPGNKMDDQPRAYSSIRRVEPSDIPLLSDIARSSHKETRFYFDRNFLRSQCNELYALWIAKSCLDDNQAVFVPRMNGRPAGYITCKLDDNRQGSIGLLAVAEWARGKGLGTEMIHVAKEWFRANDCTHVEIVTQGRNISAQRLCQRCGFHASKAESWYHWWRCSSSKYSGTDHLRQI